MLSQIWNFWNLFSYNFKLSLSFFKLKINHSDFLFFLSYKLLSIFKNVFLNVTFFVQNTQLIILINELYTHVISRVTSLLVFKNEIVHFFLKRIYNQVMFISFINSLSNYTHFFFSPCVNVPGYLRFTREFSDGKDLNRLFS